MSTDPNDQGAIGARRNEVVRSEPVNEQFAQYVQSTAFSLSLGRTHMRALIRLATRDPLWMSSNGSSSPTALHGLERRGLVTHHPHVGEPPPFGDDAQDWELTTAGKLVVMLLAEAGLVQAGLMSEFPPPPPGWTDPRPKMVPRRGADGMPIGDWDLMPSDRELAGSATTSDARS
jgi:hypothetical protein